MVKNALDLGSQIPFWCSKIRYLISLILSSEWYIWDLFIWGIAVDSKFNALENRIIFNYHIENGSETKFSWEQFYDGRFFPVNRNLWLKLEWKWAWYSLVIWSKKGTQTIIWSNFDCHFNWGYSHLWLGRQTLGVCLWGCLQIYSGRRQTINLRDFQLLNVKVNKKKLKANIPLFYASCSSQKSISISKHSYDHFFLCHNRQREINDHGDWTHLKLWAKERIFPWVISGFIHIDKRSNRHDGRRNVL